MDVLSTLKKAMEQEPKAKSTEKQKSNVDKKHDVLDSEFVKKEQAVDKKDRKVKALSVKNQGKLKENLATDRKPDELDEEKGSQVEGDTNREIVDTEDQNSAEETKRFTPENSEKKVQKDVQDKPKQELTEEKAKAAKDIAKKEDIKEKEKATQDNPKEKDTKEGGEAAQDESTKDTIKDQEAALNDAEQSATKDQKASPNEDNLNITKAKEIAPKEFRQESKEEDKKAHKSENKHTPSKAGAIPDQTKDKALEQEEKMQKDKLASPLQVKVQIGYSDYFATVREVPYEDIPTKSDQPKAKDQEKNPKISAEASGSQSDQVTESVFSPVGDDQQNFLDSLNIAAKLWMSMWKNKRNNTDQYAQWKDIYSRLTLQNQLPKTDGDPNALGWRLAQSFTGCSVLQEYIVFAAQIVQAYDEALIEDKYLNKLVEMKLYSIFRSEVNLEAVENFAYCMNYLIGKISSEEKSFPKTMLDPDGQDIIKVLKSLLDIPLSESSRESINTHRPRIILFDQVMHSLVELKKHDLSFEPIRNAWKSIKVNPIRMLELNKIKKLRVCLFEQLKYCVREQKWGLKKLATNIVSLLEPFHGCFAPLHMYFMQALLEKAFVYKEKKHPTLQTDYYALILKEFPSLCTKYGPLNIERFEILNVGGYSFVLNDVELELSQLMPKKVNSKMADAVEESSKSLQENGFVDYTFYQSSANCKVGQYYYKKQYGIPPWVDQGVAQLKIKGLSIGLKVQVVTEEGRCSEIKIVQCKCNIKDLNIVIEKSQNPKFINQVVLSYFNPYAKARIENQMCKIVFVFFKEVFQIKTF